MNRMAMCSVFLVLLGAAGCGSSEPPVKAPEPPPPAASPAAQASTASAPETPPPGVSSLASSNTGLSNTEGSNTAAANTNTNTSTNSATTLTDDQILYILHTANLGEMDQARMAEKKAKNGRVKRFATMMLKDHGEADRRGGDVAKKVQASLTPSDVSNRLESDAKQFTSTISAEKGSDFDRSYIDAQVKEHRAVLDAIDRELLPAAKAPDVKELLQTVRPKIEHHLHEAEQIQKGLGGK